MIPPRTLKARQVKKLFRRFNIRFHSKGKKGHRNPKHGYLLGPDGTIYPIPLSRGSDDVDRAYIDGARRAFRLTPEFGISDEEFYGKG